MQDELEIQSRTYRQSAWIFVVAGIIGIAASIELIVQKIAVLKNPDFVPNCDINPVLSCGSVIGTEQASLFGFPNPVLGVIGFTIVIMFGALLFTRVELPRTMWLGLNLGALLGMFFVNILQPGVGLNLSNVDLTAASEVTAKTTTLSFENFIEHIVPKSIFEAMATNEILQLVIFSIFFGVSFFQESCFVESNNRVSFPCKLI
jgi:uncharacterized membrane protein